MGAASPVSSPSEAAEAAAGGWGLVGIGGPGLGVGIHAAGGWGVAEANAAAPAAGGASGDAAGAWGDGR